MLGFYSDATFKNAGHVMPSLWTGYLSNSVFTHILCLHSRTRHFLLHCSLLVTG